MTEEKLRYKTLVDFSRILSLFESGLSEEIGVSDISKHLDMLPSKVSRMMKTLEAEAFFEKNDVSGKYRIGSRYLQASLLYSIKHPLRQVILPHLEQASIELKTLTSWGIYHNARITIVDRITFSESSAILQLLGSSSPSYASSYGMLTLAHLNQDDLNQEIEKWILGTKGALAGYSLESLNSTLRLIKAEGYSEDDGKTIPQVMGFAAPILNSDEEMVAAISITGEKARLGRKKAKVVDYLLEKARFISRQIGYQPNRYDQ